MAALILLAFLTINFSQNYINTSLTERLDALIRNQEIKVSQALDSWTESAALISNNSQLSEALGRYNKNGDPDDYALVRNILDDVLESSGVLVKLALFTPEREPIVSLGFLSEVERASILRDVSEGYSFGFYQISKTNIGKTYVHLNEPVIYEDELVAELDIIIDVTGFVEAFYDKTGLGEGGFTRVLTLTAVGNWVDISDLSIKQNVNQDLTLENISYDGYLSSFGGKRDEFITISRRISGRAVVLQVNLNKQEVFAPIDNFYHQMLMALITAMAITGVIGWLFSRQITRPITRINKTVSRIAEGEKGIEIVSEAKDPREIKTLTTNIAQMANSLWKMNENLEVVVAERTAQLTKLTENLELAVDERTQEFQEANALLLEALEELHDTKNELVKAEKMASLGELVAGVAHEINTPLGVAVTGISQIDGQLQQLETNKNTGKLTASNFDGFINETKSLVELMNDQLQVASSLIKNFKEVAVDQHNSDIRDVELNTYMNKVMDTVRPKFKPTNIDLYLDCDESLALKTRPGAFSQVVSNLLLNSLIHAFDDNEVGMVKIDCKEIGDKIKVEISDDGKGISKENLEKVFDPFFTTKRGQGGSGLGLSIVYNIVTEALGGRIEASSELGQGTTFTIELPKALKAEDISSAEVE